MWRYELHSSHQVNVATLPSESQSTENVENEDYERKLHQMYDSLIKVDQGHHVP